MPSIERLLEQNRAWAARLRSDHPETLEKMCAPQRPRHCIIGCSDSRMTFQAMLGTEQGQMFVHRNIANIVSPQDLNCLTVLQYAVEILQVERILICGHYGCGGVTAAVQQQRLGALADSWLYALTNEADARKSELEGLSEEERINWMCEKNVHNQVANVVSTSIVRNAWKAGRALYVHGWIFSQKTGLVTPLTDAIGPESLNK